MPRSAEHYYVGKLKQRFAEGRLDRREFLRTATLLGLSASAAYAFVGQVTGQSSTSPARADMPTGGTLRIVMRVHEVTNPHALSWTEGSNVVRQVCEYLTRTGHDNITRPHLLRDWKVSDDLKTWTLNLRRDVKWHSGRQFVADDVVWNLKHALAPETGSSVLGLMKPYLMKEVETETGETTDRLWDANAIEKVDDFTVRLNLKEAQLAVPEHLFHYPMMILDPEEGGRFGAGSNGTGPFELTEHIVGEHALLTARDDYWGEGPYVDTLRFVDLGDEASAWMAALKSDQVDGLYEMPVVQQDIAENMDNVRIYTATTAQTGVARVKYDHPPFDDARVRNALKYAVDQQFVLERAYRGIGSPAEHHHVAPIHPEYAELPFFERDVAKAKQLLAEAGHPDGIDIEIAAKNSPPWEVDAVQVMVEQWAEAGIRCKVNLMPASSYWDVWTEVPFGFTTWSHRPLGVMVLSLAYRCGVPWNESSYCNPEFDRLLTKAEGIVDPEERSKVMAKLQRILQEDGTIIQPFWRGLLTVHHERVKGFQEHPSQYIFGEQLAVDRA